MKLSSFLLGLDYRRHVVVIDQRHALGFHPFGEFRHPAAIGLHLVARQFGLRGERLRLVALDRAARLRHRRCKVHRRP